MQGRNELQSWFRSIEHTVYIPNRPLLRCHIKRDDWSNDTILVNRELRQMALHPPAVLWLLMPSQQFSRRGRFKNVEWRSLYAWSKLRTLKLVSFGIILHHFSPFLDWFCSKFPDFVNGSTLEASKVCKGDPPWCLQLSSGVTLTALPMTKNHGLQSLRCTYVAPGQVKRTFELSLGMFQ